MKHTYFLVYSQVETSKIEKKNSLILELRSLKQSKKRLCANRDVLLMQR